MSVKSYFRRIEHENEFMSNHTRCSNTKSPVSLHDLDSRSYDASQTKDLSDSNPSMRRISLPWILNENLTSPCQRDRICFIDAADTQDEFENVRTIELSPVAIYKQEDNDGYISNGTQRSPAKESFGCLEIYQPRISPDTFKLDNLINHFANTSLSQNRTINDKSCEIIPIQTSNAIQSKTFDQCNGNCRESKASSNTSLSISSHSPSPVRSQVISPFAAGTIAPSFTLSDRTYAKLPPYAHIPTVVASSSSNHKSENHTTSRNPFDSDDSDESSSKMSNQPRNPPLSFVQRTRPASTNPFDDSPPSTPQVTVKSFDSRYRSDDIPNQSLGPSYPVKFRRYRKKPAPAPPTHVDPSDRLLYVNRNVLTNSLSCSTTDVAHHAASPNYRASSLCLAAKFDSNSDSHAAETRSMIVKRHAPSPPIYNKRFIKGDSSDSYMSYTELHEQLYTTNRRINHLEAQARKLQEEIKNANRRHTNMGAALEKWTKVVEIRDALSRKHTQLLERLRRQELEERHAHLEYEFRQLWAKPAELKTPAEKERERKLLDELLETVNQRAELVDRWEEISELYVENTSTTKNRKSRKLYHGLVKRMRNLRSRSHSALLYKT